MANRKINLSGPTISPNTYAGLFSEKYIAAALLSGDTLAKDLIRRHPHFCDPVEYSLIIVIVGAVSTACSAVDSTNSKKRPLPIPRHGHYYPQF